MMNEKLEQFGRRLSAACMAVKSLVVDEVNVTIVCRHRNEPQSHMLLGDDDLDGLQTFIDEMRASPSKLEAIASVDGCTELTPYTDKS